MESPPLTPIAYCLLNRRRLESARVGAWIQWAWAVTWFAATRTTSEDLHWKESTCTDLCLITLHGTHALHVSSTPSYKYALHIAATCISAVVQRSHCCDCRYYNAALPLRGRIKHAPVSLCLSVPHNCPNSWTKSPNNPLHWCTHNSPLIMSKSCCKSFTGLFVMFAF